MTEDLGYGIEVDEGYDEAVVRTRLALRAEGFSIITEMHVGGLLGPEAGDERQYLIMGAWAPPTNNRDLGSNLQVAVHLPCNFVVQETGGSALVAALDPEEAAEQGIGESAEAGSEAREALGRVFKRIQTA